MGGKLAAGLRSRRSLPNLEQEGREKQKRALEGNHVD